MSHNRVTISEAQEEEEEVVEGVGVEVLPEGFSLTYWAGCLAHLGFSWV